MFYGFSRLSPTNQNKLNRSSTQQKITFSFTLPRPCHDDVSAAQSCGMRFCRDEVEKRPTKPTEAEIIKKCCTFGCSSLVWFQIHWTIYLNKHIVVGP